MKILSATETDVPAIVRLNDALFQEDAGQRDPTVNLAWAKEHGRGHFQRLVEREDGLCLLALVDGEIVGYLAGYTRQKSNYKLVKTAELESMFVRPAFRGQGVGTAFVHHFLAWTSELEAEQVQVTAFAANEKALLFYQGLGFAAQHITLEMAL